MLTAEMIKNWRDSYLGSNCSVLLDEIERLQVREVALLEANNRDMELRRMAERERDGLRETVRLQSIALADKDWRKQEAMARVNGK